MTIENIEFIKRETENYEKLMSNKEYQYLIKEQGKLLKKIKETIQNMEDHPNYKVISCYDHVNTIKELSLKLFGITALINHIWFEHGYPTKR